MGTEIKEKVSFKFSFLFSFFWPQGFLGTGSENEGKWKSVLFRLVLLTYFVYVDKMYILIKIFTVV